MGDVNRTIGRAAVASLVLLLASCASAPIQRPSPEASPVVELSKSPISSEVKGLLSKYELDLSNWDSAHAAIRGRAWVVYLNKKGSDTSELNFFSDGAFSAIINAKILPKKPSQLSLSSAEYRFNRIFGPLSGWKIKVESHVLENHQMPRWLIGGKVFRVIATKRNSGIQARFDARTGQIVEVAKWGGA